MSNAGNSLRRAIPPGKMTKKDFVREAGISLSTLQRLRKNKIVNPTSIQRGELTIFLYDQDNVNEVTQYMKGTVAS